MFVCREKGGIYDFARRIFISFLGLFFLNACTVGPNYYRPPVVATAKFKEAKGNAFTHDNKDWKVARPQDIAHRGEWWRVFNDSRLNELEEQLNQYNQNIANNLANYSQSLAIVDEARASYFPTLSGNFSITRQKSGGGATSFLNGAGGGSSTTSTGAGLGLSTISTNYIGSLNANWEPDIWGLVRRTVEADASVAQANQALLAATRLSAQGALAQYYFELVALDRDQYILDLTVAGYKATLKLTRNQYAAGVASRADIVQAQSLVETAEAQAINNHILRAQYEHAIAVLIGRPPASFALAPKLLKLKPPVIPVTVPSVWLERRPDIAQAERLLQQTNAQIGIATAAYYPVLDLTGALNAAAPTLGKLFSVPTIGWLYGTQLAEAIYDGGLRNATVRAAKAGYMAQVAAYRQTVLTAFQDVEDNLVSLRMLNQQAVAQNKAAASSKKALALVINQYKQGTVPFSSVITAQISAYTAEKNAYDTAGLQMTAAVGLIKALGGGWDVSEIRYIKGV